METTNSFITEVKVNNFTDKNCETIDFVQWIFESQRADRTFGTMLRSFPNIWYIALLKKLACICRVNASKLTCFTRYLHVPLVDCVWGLIYEVLWQRYLSLQVCLRAPFLQYNNSFHHWSHSGSAHAISL